jgi:hypothetical protein
LAEGQWLYARDGALTLRNSLGWWAGCSLPARAARRQLQTLDARAPVACFLDPPHPAYLRTALEKSDASQAVVALVPDATAMGIHLAADDLSREIAAHRLWFVVGADWPKQLRELFRAHPGLATPTQFIRLNLPDVDRLEPIIATAREVIAQVTSERTQTARGLSAAWKQQTGPARRLCVVSRRMFRLWNDAGAVLGGLKVLPRPSPVESVEGAAHEESGRIGGNDFAIRTPPDSSAALLTDAAGVGTGGTEARHWNVELLCSDDPLTGSTLELLRSAVACDPNKTAEKTSPDQPQLMAR